METIELNKIYENTYHKFKAKPIEEIALFNFGGSIGRAKGIKCKIPGDGQLRDNVYPYDLFLKEFQPYIPKPKADGEPKQDPCSVERERKEIA